MKRVLMPALLLSFVFFIACTNDRSTNDVPRTSKDVLKAALGSPNLVLIDVRSEKDWGESDMKISGAVRMDPKAFEEWSGTLPKDRDIVLYCA